MNKTQRERYWVEGRADAIVDMVGAGLFRGTLIRAEDVAKQLAVPHGDLVAAAQRRKARLQRKEGLARPFKLIQPPPVVPEGHKWCPRCRQSKLLDCFGNNKNEYLGKAPYCRPCWNAYARDRYRTRRTG